MYVHAPSNSGGSEDETKDRTMNCEEEQCDNREDHD
jgi:hypothetical protein